jgi:nitronate monooxygenase
MALQALLGIQRPIIQAPMAGVQGSDLCIAVSNAGGLGSLPCAMLNSEQLLTEINNIKGATGQPYNLNFFCHQQPEQNNQQQSQWRKLLQPYYKELQLDSDTPFLAPSRQPFSHVIADLIEDLQPPVISFHFGLPSPDLLRRVKSWGCKILGCATTLAEAQWLEARGVDAIIAQGIEAGGHRGMFLSTELNKQNELSTLLSQLRGQISLPIIAAGGLANAEDVSIALSQGASGAQLGSAYLLCPETNTSTVHRAAIRSEAARSTIITNVFSGRPARGIVNRLIREIGPINSEVPDFPHASDAIAPLRKQSESLACGDFSPLWAGTKASQCLEISAGELTRRLDPQTANT